MTLTTLPSQPGTSPSDYSRLLVTTMVWIGALKFTNYEVENAEPLVTASPLTSRLRKKLGAQKLAQLVGVGQITLGALIAAKPIAARARYRSCLCWARTY